MGATGIPFCRPADLVLADRDGAAVEASLSTTGFSAAATERTSFFAVEGFRGALLVAAAGFAFFFPAAGFGEGRRVFTLFFAFAAISRLGFRARCRGIGAERFAKGGRVLPLLLSARTRRLPNGLFFGGLQFGAMLSKP
jgi:hypothetical protein